MIKWAHHVCVTRVPNAPKGAFLFFRRVCEDDEYADCTTRRVCYDRPLQRCLQEQCNGCTRDTAEDCPKACTIVDELQCTETERLCTDEQEARLVCPEVIAWPVKQK